jgi:3-methyladenine DNA glycosylase AlkD
MNFTQISKELQAVADPEKAKILSGYFKTGKGEYGEGDIFIGIVVPKIRKVAHQFIDADFETIQELLDSKIHEYRLTALEILVAKYEKTKDEKLKEKIYKFYLKNTKSINNWDLVDLSASYIVGDYLLKRDRGILYKLVKSKNLWERRISIISTHAFIKEGQYEDTFKICEILLGDKHDLIYKATGWMLREVGKRISRPIEMKFLDKHAKKMPRIMLSYAIEHFSNKEKTLL